MRAPTTTPQMKAFLQYCERAGSDREILVRAILEISVLEAGNPGAAAECVRIARDALCRLSDKCLEKIS